MFVSFLRFVPRIVFRAMERHSRYTRDLFTFLSRAVKCLVPLIIRLGARLSGAFVRARMFVQSMARPQTNNVQCLSFFGSFTSPQPDIYICRLIPNFSFGREEMKDEHVRANIERSLFSVRNRSFGFAWTHSSRNRFPSAEPRRNDSQRLEHKEIVPKATNTLQLSLLRETFPHSINFQVQNPKLAYRTRKGKTLCLTQLSIQGE